MTDKWNEAALKPSERIGQLVNEEHAKRPATCGLDAVDIGLNAIVKYLDEQHAMLTELEKEK